MQQATSGRQRTTRSGQRRGRTDGKSAAQTLASQLHARRLRKTNCLDNSPDCPRRFLAQKIRILREYERGVIFRLGKLLGTKGPGLIFLI
jgi:hypothetical protein